MSEATGLYPACFLLAVGRGQSTEAWIKEIYKNPSDINPGASEYIFTF